MAIIKTSQTEPMDLVGNQLCRVQNYSQMEERLNKCDVEGRVPGEVPHSRPRARAGHLLLHTPNYTAGNRI